ncbi:MAG: hypothetical protein AAF622_11935, partial [Cyanobacteria bacterium P01_C01_bin.147]
MRFCEIPSLLEKRGYTGGSHQAGEFVRSRFAAKSLIVSRSRRTMGGAAAPRWAKRQLMAMILTAGCLSFSHLSGAAQAARRQAIAVTPPSGALTGTLLPIPKQRFADLWQGILRGKDAFWAEVQKGGFVA